MFCGQDKTCQGVVFLCLSDNADNARLGLVSVFKKTFFFVAKIKLYKQLQIISRPKGLFEFEAEFTRSQENAFFRNPLRFYDSNSVY